MTKFGQAEYSDKGRSIRRFRNGRIYYWIACKAVQREYSQCVSVLRQSRQMKICQIRTSNFVRFGDTILKRFVVSLLVERRVRKCRQ